MPHKHIVRVGLTTAPAGSSPNPCLKREISLLVARSAAISAWRCRLYWLGLQQLRRVLIQNLIVLTVKGIFPKLSLAAL